MAIVSGMPPILRHRRSAQSGQKTMTAVMQVVYTENTTSSLLAYLFEGAEIDLSTMQAGDTIIIRIRKVLLSGGAWVIHDQLTFTGAQPVTHPSVRIAGIPDIHGVEIAMQQTAGVLRTIDCEFYDAKRLGLP